MTDIDNPHLTSGGTHFGDNSFDFPFLPVLKYAFSSLLTVLMPLVWRTICVSEIRHLLQTSHVVKSRTELDTLPLDMEDLWIGRFDTTGITEYSFSAFQSLRSLVIGNSIFWEVTSFELSNLPSLQSIDIGRSFRYALSFSLTGLIIATLSNHGYGANLQKVTQSSLHLQKRVVFIHQLHRHEVVQFRDNTARWKITRLLRHSNF